MTLQRSPAAGSLCELASRPEEVDAVCLHLRSFLQTHGRAADSFVVELLAREALNNALQHGHQGQGDQPARLILRLGHRWLRLQITDAGAGFNWRAARHRTAAPAAISGRGLAISALYADRVAFNQRGNQITLWLDNRNTAKRHQHGKLHP